MNINLKQLETFVCVADLGSFRRAADRLCTTQPNVSSRIAALESTLGMSLMDRDAGSVRLTGEGISVLGHARKVLKSVEELLDSTQGENLYNGVLRLGVTEMVVHTWLRDFLKVFKERFPNILVELKVDLSVNLDYDLSERSIDIAFQSGPFTRKTTGEEPLGAFPIIWVASPSLPLSSKTLVSAEDLAEFPILTHARNTWPYQEVAAHFANFSNLNVRMVPSSNLTACLQMTIDGYGVAAVLAPMVENEIKAKQLVRLNYDWVPESLGFFARYDAHRCSSVVSKAAQFASSISLAFQKEFEQRKI